MENTIVAIGFTSGYTCYLNMTVEEACAKYDKDHPDYKIADHDLVVKSFKFGDTFFAYDIWGNE